MTSMQVKVLIFLFLVAALSGCATDRLNQDGLKLISEGQYEDGVAKLEQATKSDPSNLHYRTVLLNKRDEVINRLLVSADQERAAGRFEEAEKIYRRVLIIEPGNARAQAGGAELAKDRRHQVLIDEARELFDKSDTQRKCYKYSEELDGIANSEVIVFRQHKSTSL